MAHRSVFVYYLRKRFVIMPPVNILIKPASSACNIGCSYCFYKDVSAHREHEFEGMLSLEMMEKVIASGMEYADHSCSFAFQGGEPTLAGLEFYKNVLEIEKKYQKPGVEIHNSIQTNGIVVNEDWARFFAENHFLVGLSLDGPAEIHNLNRIDRQQRGTFNTVMNAVRLFRKYQVDFNILCVLTDKSARSIEKIFRFYRKEGFQWLQFIPCLDPFGQDGKKSVWSLSEESYSEFLLKIFDLWFTEYKKGNYISIRHLDNWLAMMLGDPPESCNMCGQCSVQYVIEGDGSVYPCDFYVLDEWKLGNVGEQSFLEMLKSKKANDFITASRIIPEACRGCRWYPLCRNGCRRERDANGLNIHCKAVSQFFTARYPQLRQAAMMVDQKRYENSL